MGVGIVTYQHILWTLSCVFLIFSIMLLPTLGFFSDGTGYKGENPKFAKYESNMLGNMGYSSVQCTSVPLDIGKLNIQCPYGTVGKITSYGVNLSDDTANNCLEKTDADFVKCKPDATEFIDTGLEAVVGKSVHVLNYGDWQNLYTKPAEKASCMKQGESRLFAEFTCIQSQ